MGEILSERVRILDCGINFMRLRWHCRYLLLALVSLLSLAESARGEGSSEPSAAAASAVKPISSLIEVPRITGRLMAKDLGLVINVNDPYSVRVGQFYIEARQLSEAQVLRVELPVRAELSVDEFQALDARIRQFFGPEIQALALAWTQPFAVDCLSITGAIAMGFDHGLCSKTCAPSRKSSYLNAFTTRPFTDLQMRPSMLLAAKSAAMAEEMIRRGVASDHSLGLRGSPSVHAHFLITTDSVRSSRASLFPPPGLLRGVGIDVHVEKSNVLQDADRLLIYETGLSQVDKLDTLRWVPGGVGDHLTSYGGRLDGKGGQMSALEWIASGATGSYGTVSEPCSHPQKFPHPQILLLHYAQGASLIEAYWKSVAWPQQGLFIGEPLAAPFARR
jgi:uncharacterized protein (TIGR03790 family)